MTSGKEPDRNCGGRTGLPKAGCVKWTMAAAGLGVTGGSGRKTEDPRGCSPPDLFHGALRVRAGNSCWLPRFRTIIKYLLSSHCVQREFQKNGTLLNSFPFLTATDLEMSEEGAWDSPGIPGVLGRRCFPTWLLVPPSPLGLCLAAFLIGRGKSRRAMHTYTHTDTHM